MAIVFTLPNILSHAVPAVMLPHSRWPDLPVNIINIGSALFQLQPSLHQSVREQKCPATGRRSPVCSLQRRTCVLFNKRSEKKMEVKRSVTEMWSRQTIKSIHHRGLCSSKINGGSPIWRNQLSGTVCEIPTPNGQILDCSARLPTLCALCPPSSSLVYLCNVRMKPANQVYQLPGIPKWLRKIQANCSKTLDLRVCHLHSYLFSICFH